MDPGAGSPLLIPGLHNTVGVGSVAAGGTPTNYDEILDGVATFLNANNRLDQLSGMIWHPDVWKTYAKLNTGISPDKTTFELSPAIQAVPKVATTNADTVTSPEDYHVVLGVRMNPTIRVLDGTTSMASNLLVEIIGVARIDFLAARPPSFVVLSGIGAA